MAVTLNEENKTYFAQREGGRPDERDHGSALI